MLVLRDGDAIRHTRLQSGDVACYDSEKKEIHFFRTNDVIKADGTILRDSGRIKSLFIYEWRTKAVFGGITLKAVQLAGVEGAQEFMGILGIPYGLVAGTDDRSFCPPGASVASGGTCSWFVFFAPEELKRIIKKIEIFNEGLNGGGELGLEAVTIGK